MIRRVLLTLLGLALTVVLGGIAAVLWITKGAEPAYSGEVTLVGLKSPVRVRMGPHMVPTLHGDSLRDVLFAQGFMVASERMWQMDLMRRLADGRLAEVFGPDALDLDQFFRTVGLNTSARRALADLEPPYRAMLDAYAAGVNAYQEKANGRLPIEYRLAGFTPAPWAPEDSLVIGAYMAWTQSFNLKSELTFLRLAARVGAERARELVPTDAGVPAPPVPADLPNDVLAGASQASRSLIALLERPVEYGLPAAGAASNAWVLSGRRSANGSALLANDPHLAASMPSIWYEMELIAPDLHVTGLVLPGVPLVLIGHNADLAWGFTSVMADNQDLFLERLSDDAEAVKRAGGADEPVVTRVQRIPVKGGESVEFKVRSTSNGVVLNEILVSPLAADGADPGGLPAVKSNYLLTLRQATDLPDRGFPALHRLNRASTLEQARQAILGFRQVAQNLMLAHRDGGIAWQVSGLLPRRGRGSGAFPVPGWVAGYGWHGFVDQGTNPGRSDPLGAALITANNRTIPLDYPVVVSHSWMAPYRAERIAERLDAAGSLGVADLADIQADRVSIQARLTQQAINRLEARLRRVDPTAWTIAERDLLNWDGTMDGASRAAALYALVEPALYRELYGDELGEDLEPLMGLAIVSYNPIQEAIRSGQSSFWDDIATPETEGPEHIWGRALRAAAADLATRLPAPDQQRLDRLRQLTFPHSFHHLPLLGPLFDVGPLGVGGSSDTINVAKATPLAPERVLFVPSARIIQVPARWGESRGTLPLGQSGHRLSRYRTDQLDDWLAGRSHPWPWNGPDPDRTLGLLVLRPSGS